MVRSYSSVLFYYLINWRLVKCMLCMVSVNSIFILAEILTNDLWRRVLIFNKQITELSKLTFSRQNVNKCIFLVDFKKIRQQPRTRYWTKNKYRFQRSFIIVSDCNNEFRSIGQMTNLWWLWIHRWETKSAKW